MEHFMSSQVPARNLLGSRRLAMCLLVYQRTVIKLNNASAMSDVWVPGLKPMKNLFLERECQQNMLYDCGLSILSASVGGKLSAKKFMNAVLVWISKPKSSIKRFLFGPKYYRNMISDWNLGQKPFPANIPKEAELKKRFFVSPVRYVKKYEWDLFWYRLFHYLNDQFPSFPDVTLWVISGAFDERSVKLMFYCEEISSKKNPRKSIVHAAEVHYFDPPGHQYTEEIDFLVSLRGKEPKCLFQIMPICKPNDWHPISPIFGVTGVQSQSSPTSGKTVGTGKLGDMRFYPIKKKKPVIGR